MLTRRKSTSSTIEHSEKTLIEYAATQLTVNNYGNSSKSWFDESDIPLRNGAETPPFNYPSTSIEGLLENLETNDDIFHNSLVVEEYFKNIYFERRKILTNLINKLSAKTMQIIWGPSGVGKTSLAVQYICSYGRDIETYPGGVFCHSLSKNQDDPEECLRIFLERLSGVRRNAFNKNEKNVWIREVREKLKNREKTLFVFDNVKHYEDLNPYLTELSQKSNSFLIISTIASSANVRIWSGDKHEEIVRDRLFPLHKFSEDELKLLLSKYDKFNDLESTVKAKVLRTCSEVFGNLPIFIRLIIEAYIESKNNNNLENFLQDCQSKEEDCDDIKNSTRGIDIHRNSCYEVLSTQLKTLSSGAQSLLYQCAFLGQNTLSEDFLKGILLYAYNDSDPEKYEQERILNEVKDSFFLEGKSKYSIHSIFRKFLKKQSHKDIERDSLVVLKTDEIKTLLEFFLCIIPHDFDRQSPTSIFDKYLPYATKFIDEINMLIIKGLEKNADRYQNELLLFSSLCLNITYLYYRKSDFVIADKFSSISEKIAEKLKVINEESSDHNLHVQRMKGKLLTRMREYGKAEAVYSKAIELIESEFNTKSIQKMSVFKTFIGITQQTPNQNRKKEHLSILKSCLASLYLKRCFTTWKKAYLLLDESLDSKKNNNSNKKEIAITLQIKGNFFYKIGDFSKALEMYELADIEFENFYKNSNWTNLYKQQYENHEFYLTLLRHKSKAQRMSGFFDLAINSAKGLLNIYKHKCGFSESHHSILSTELELAKCFFSQNKIITASKKVNMILSVNADYADALYFKGKIENSNGGFLRARELFVQALKIYYKEQTGGENISITFDSCNKNENNVAEILNTLSVNNYTQSLDTSCAKTLHQIGLTYYNEGKYLEASSFITESFNVSVRFCEIYETVNATIHPRIILAKFDMARLKYRSGDYTEAERLAGAVLQEQCEIYGKKYSICFTSMEDNESKNNVIYLKIDINNDDKKEELIYQLISSSKILISGVIKSSDMDETYYRQIYLATFKNNKDDLSKNARNALYTHLAKKGIIYHNPEGLHYEVAETNRLILRIMLRQGRLQEANDKLNEIFKIYKTLDGLQANIDNHVCYYLTLYSEARLNSYRAQYKISYNNFEKTLNGLCKIYSHLPSFPLNEHPELKDLSTKYKIQHFPNHGYIARTLASLGKLYSLAGRYKYALMHYDMGQLMCEKSNLSDHSTIAMIEKYRGDTLYMCKRDNISIIKEHFKKALKITNREKVIRHSQGSSIHLSLALLYVHEGSPIYKIDKHFFSSLELLEQICGKNNELIINHHRFAEILLAKGNFYFKYGNYAKANKNYKEALDVVTKLNKNDKKDFFNPRWIELETEYILLLNKLGALDSAYERLAILMKNVGKCFVSDSDFNVDCDLQKMAKLFVAHYENFFNESNDQIPEFAIGIAMLCKAVSIIFYYSDKDKFNPILIKKLLGIKLKILGALSKEGGDNKYSFGMDIFYFNYFLWFANVLSKEKKYSDAEKIFSSVKLRHDIFSGRSQLDLVDFYFWEGFNHLNEYVDGKQKEIYGKCIESLLKSLKFKIDSYANIKEKNSTGDTSTLDIATIATCHFRLFVHGEINEIPLDTRNTFFLRWKKEAQRFVSGVIFQNQNNSKHDFNSHDKINMTDIISYFSRFFTSINNISESTLDRSSSISRTEYARILYRITLFYSDLVYLYQAQYERLDSHVLVTYQKILDLEKKILGLMPNDTRAKKRFDETCNYLIKVFSESNIITEKLNDFLDTTNKSMPILIFKLNDNFDEILKLYNIVFNWFNKFSDVTLISNPTCYFIGDNKKMNYISSLISYAEDHSYNISFMFKNTVEDAIDNILNNLVGHYSYSGAGVQIKELSYTEAENLIEGKVNTLVKDCSQRRA